MTTVPASTDPPRLLTHKEAATFLRMSERQLRVLRDAGKIAWINIGNGLKRPKARYQINDLHRFIAERTRQCPSTSDPAALNTPTTSSSGVVDFPGRRSAQRGEKPKGSKPKSGKKPGKDTKTGFLEMIGRSL